MRISDISPETMALLSQPGEPVVYPTKFSVSMFPDIDDEDHWNFSVTVEYRGRGLWAVTNRFSYNLGRDGEFSYEPRSTERTDDWLEDHRFPLEEAVRLAREVAPKLTVNGWTVERVREHKAQVAADDHKDLLWPDP